MRIVLALILALWAAPAMAQLVTTPTEVMRGAVNNFIRPAMANFQTKSNDLSGAMTALCAAPSAGNLETADSAFGGAALAFARIEALRVGPLMEDNRSDRILFWPDRKGIALKQVQAILATSDETATDATSLKGKSVAVQGLTALEYVLYGTGFEALTGDAGAFRCRFGAAIAQNIATMADELVAGWNDPAGIALHLMKPSPDFVDYRTPIEAQEELVGILSHGVEAVRDTRINPWIAKDDTAAKPKLALFWRSGLAVPMIQADLEGLSDLFWLSGVGTAVNADDAGLMDQIQAGFEDAFVALALVTDPVETAVADPVQAQALTDVVTVTQSLGSLIGEQLSAALGLSVGFSSLDGD